MFVFSIPEPRSSNKSYTTSQPIIDRYHMTFQEFYSPTESVHGLICSQQSGNPIVWNPSMRQFLPLPKPSKVWTDLTVFLGYDPIEGKHKVVCLPRVITCSVYQVLTLGSTTKEFWRSIETNIRHHSFDESYGRCINVIYHLAYFYDLHVSGIMSLDVRSEECHMIKLPSDIDRDMLITYQGKLACVKRHPTKNELWILEDAEKHEWLSKHFRTPFDQSDPRNIFKLSGITLAGELVYTPLRFRNRFVLFFMIRRETTLEKSNTKDSQTTNSGSVMDLEMDVTIRSILS